MQIARQLQFSEESPDLLDMLNEAEAERRRLPEVVDRLLSRWRYAPLAGSARENESCDEKIGQWGGEALLDNEGGGEKDTRRSDDGADKLPPTEKMGTLCVGGGFQNEVDLELPPPLLYDYYDRRIPASSYSALISRAKIVRQSETGTDDRQSGESVRKEEEQLRKELEAMREVSKVRQRKRRTKSYRECQELSTNEMRRSRG